MISYEGGYGDKGDMGMHRDKRGDSPSGPAIECIIELKTVDVPAFKADYRKITLQ